MSDTLSQEPKPKGMIAKSLPVLLTALVAGAGGFGAAVYYSESRLSPTEEVLRLIERNSTSAAEDAPERQTRDIPKAPLFETNYYEFPEALTTNLAGSSSFLQISIGISTQYDTRVIENVERHAMALRSDMLAVISSFSEEAVQGVEGRAALSEAIADALNTRLERLEGFGGVEAVYFPSFVLQ